VWSFVVALVIGFIVRSLGLFRAKREAELDGIDIAEHKESAYDFSNAGGGGGGAFAQAGIGTVSMAGAQSAEPAEPAKV
jgi:Amt family ammonium transporter